MLWMQASQQCSYILAPLSNMDWGWVARSGKYWLCFFLLLLSCTIYYLEGCTQNAVEGEAFAA